MATRRPIILPMRKRPEPRPAPYDLLPLADPTGGYPSTGELIVMLLLMVTLTISMVAFVA